MKNNYNHPIEVTLDVVCGKWKAIILSRLLNHTLRFGELKREIPKISQKVLTAQLRELEKDNLVKRVVYKQVPPKVEYSLTAYGEKLRPLLNDMSDWGESHMNMVNHIKEDDNLVTNQEVIK